MAEGWQKNERLKGPEWAKYNSTYFSLFVLHYEFSTASQPLLLLSLRTFGQLGWSRQCKNPRPGEGVQLAINFILSSFSTNNLVVKALVWENCVVKCFTILDKRFQHEIIFEIINWKMLLCNLFIEDLTIKNLQQNQKPRWISHLSSFDLRYLFLIKYIFIGHSYTNCISFTF